MRISKAWHNTLVVLFFSSLIASMALYLAFYPPSQSQFFVFDILNSAGTDQQNLYFPSGNNTVMISQNVSWTLQVKNHMHDLQYVEIRVKLLNASLPSLNPDQCSASPIHELFGYRQLISPGDIWNSTILWMISSGTVSGSSSAINTIRFNGTTYSPRLQATNGAGYRLLFELWRFDPTESTWSFSFQGSYEGSPRVECWWTLMYFRVT